MIECYLCHTVIDVDDDLANELGWEYRGEVYEHFGDYENKENYPYETVWYCPNCLTMEDN